MDGGMDGWLLLLVLYHDFNQRVLSFYVFHPVHCEMCRAGEESATIWRSIYLSKGTARIRSRSATGLCTVSISGCLLKSHKIPKCKGERLGGDAVGYTCYLLQDYSATEITAYIVHVSPEECQAMLNIGTSSCNSMTSGGTYEVR